MATKHATSRPHCVDLTPSVFATRGNQDASRRTSRQSDRVGKKNLRNPDSSNNGVFNRLFTGRSTSNDNRTARVDRSSKSRGISAPASRGRSYGQSDVHPGAVRLSTSADDRNPTHLGKLCAAVALVAGAIIWTSSASEQFTSSSSDQKETLQATIVPPAFFFDDDADALNNKLAQTSTNQVLPAGPVPTESDTLSESENPVAMANALDVTQWHEVTATQSDTSAPDVAPAVVTGEKIPPIAMLSNTRSLTEKTEPASNSGLFKVTVALGDTLSGILNKNGLKADQMHQLLSNEVVKDHLSNIDIGQVFELTRDDTGIFKSLTTRVGNDRRVNINRTDAGFDVTSIELSIERERVATSGRINQSLYLAAEQANLKQSTIMELANIFQWELDFARDIRQGDSFSLVYDRLFREGEYIGDGDILAAEFVRGGKSYKAIRFTTDEGVSGYYSPDGQSKRRTFMRHPVDVVRITSKFNPNRLHPVLHKIRAHRGVDYGSPHGSPIYATADGRVIFSGNKNAYGKTVVLKHGEKFSTLYAHMSRISDKSQVGKRVKQGDVIGYVGKTGRVTGTHLHYEFRVNGTQIDPLKVELPAAAPIDKKYRNRLKALSEEMSLLMSRALAESDGRVASAPISAR